MKPRIVAKTPVKVPVWQQSAKTEPVLDRLRKITRDLQIVQGELYCTLAEADGTAKKDFTALASASQDIAEFKAAVDQLRRVLWFYLDGVTQSAGTGSIEPDEATRLQQATELLHTLTPQAAATIIEPGSFFERLNLVIDGYMQHNEMSGATRRKKR
jgi:hypothetical protein